MPLEVDTRDLSGDLDCKSLDRLLAHYRAAWDAARDRMAEASEPANGPAHLRYAVDVLERLPVVWAETSPEARDALAGSIWPAGLTFAGERECTEEPV